MHETLGSTDWDWPTEFHGWHVVRRLDRRFTQFPKGRVAEVRSDDGRRGAAKIIAHSGRLEPPEIAHHRRVASNPAVISLYDAFALPDEPGYWVLVMELGECSLRERLGKQVGALEADELLQMFSTFGLLLDVCRELKLVHADIKPDNIQMVGGVPKLADFGSSLELDGSYARGPATTLLYLPPETGLDPVGMPQVRPAWDVWALGVTVHEAACGRHPFSTSKVSAPHEIIANVQNYYKGDATALKLDPDLDRRLRSLLFRCLDRDRTRRIQPDELRATARQMVEGYRGRNRGDRIQRRPFGHEWLDDWTASVPVQHPTSDVSGSVRLKSKRIDVTLRIEDGVIVDATREDPRDADQTHQLPTGSILSWFCRPDRTPVTRLPRWSGLLEAASSQRPSSEDVAGFTRIGIPNRLRIIGWRVAKWISIGFFFLAWPFRAVLNILRWATQRVILLRLLTAMIVLGGAAFGTLFGIDTFDSRQHIAAVVVAGDRPSLTTLSTTINGADAGLERPTGPIVINGAVYFADSGHDMIRAVAPDDTVIPWIGSGRNGSSTGNGSPLHVELSDPVAVASTSEGLWIDDYLNRRLLLDTSDQVRVVAGSGVSKSVDGNGREASFYSPRDISPYVTGPVGSILVADGDAIREVSSTGRVTTLLSRARYGWTDAYAVASTADGSIWVEDSKGLHRVDKAGKQDFLGGGNGNGLSLVGLAPYSSTEVLWADGSEVSLVGSAGTVKSIQVKPIDTDAGPISITVTGVAVDGSNLVVTGQGAIDVVASVDWTGKATLMAGSAGFSKTGPDRCCRGPVALAETADDTLWVATSWDDELWGYRHSDSGKPPTESATTADLGKAHAGWHLTQGPIRLPFPTQEIAADGKDLLIAAGNELLQLHNSHLSVVAGSPTAGDQIGSSTDTRFSDLSGVAVGRNGTIYLSDSGNNRLVEISADHQSAKSIAGLGAPTPPPGSNPTKISYPGYLALDNEGRPLFLNGDPIDGNPASVLRIETDGSVTRVLGATAFSTTNQTGALDTNLAYAQAIAVGPHDMLLVSTWSVGESAIFSFQNGQIRLVEGGAQGDGQSNDTRFGDPTDIAVVDGRLFVADDTQDVVIQLSGWQRN